MKRAPLTQRERQTTCLGCGGTVHLPKSAEPLICLRCRAKVSTRKDAAPLRPFEKFDAPKDRPRRTFRTTTLLFALVLIVAAFVALREQSQKEQTKPSPTPSSQTGGVEVMFEVPSPSSSK